MSSVHLDFFLRRCVEREKGVKFIIDKHSRCSVNCFDKILRRVHNVMKEKKKKNKKNKYSAETL